MGLVIDATLIWLLICAGVYVLMKNRTPRRRVADVSDEPWRMVMDHKDGWDTFLARRKGVRDETLIHIRKTANETAFEYASRLEDTARDSRSIVDAMNQARVIGKTR